MGRNGAGKSTLLRLAKGLDEPTRGSIERAGEVALLLQNPGDYLVHGHAVEDAGVAGVAAAGLAGREEANPRDLSGGERQRLALEVVLAGDTLNAVVLLDEPTRGMDRIHKDALASRIKQLAERGSAVMVATHDTEFAASLANRIVLLGQGVVIADGPPEDILGGGRHFSTEVAWVTGGATLLPEEGSKLSRRETPQCPNRSHRREEARGGTEAAEEATRWHRGPARGDRHDLASRLPRPPRHRPRRRLRLVRAREAAGGWSRSWPRSPRSRWWAGSRSRRSPT